MCCLLAPTTWIIFSSVSWDLLANKHPHGFPLSSSFPTKPGARTRTKQPRSFLFPEVCISNNRSRQRRQAISVLVLPNHRAQNVYFLWLIHPAGEAYRKYMAIMLHCDILYRQIRKPIANLVKGTKWRWSCANRRERFANALIRNYP